MVDYKDACFGDCGVPCDSRCNHYGKHYKVLLCDKCGHQTEELYDIDGTEVCEDCLLTMFPTTEDVCEECGETDIVFDIGGQLLCETCLREYFPVLTEEDM